PRADLQLQDLRPGVRDDAGRTGGRKPDDHHAALRHGVQIFPLRRGLRDGGLRLRHAHDHHRAAMAAAAQTDRVLTSELKAMPTPGMRWRWLALLAVACGAIVVFFPFFWMAVTSLKTAPEIQRVPLQITPDHWLNFANYLEVFKREPFLRYLA